MLFPWKFFESPTPHTRERLATSVYLIITTEKSFRVLGLLRAAVGWVLSAARGWNSPEQGLCAGPGGQWGRKSHIWPLISAGESWHLSAAGRFHTELTGWGNQEWGFACPGTEGFVLPWLPPAFFDQGLILQAARFCWEFGHSSAIRQEKEEL